ncbi:hypothetical protein J6590_095489 [Homalodisca vitripennis]|nr:hypothetical protein J6590_095489 [Homalodisca vitripennis]
MANPIKALGHVLRIVFEISCSTPLSESCYPFQIQFTVLPVESQLEYKAVEIELLVNLLISYEIDKKVKSQENVLRYLNDGLSETLRTKSSLGDCAYPSLPTKYANESQSFQELVRKK